MLARRKGRNLDVRPGWGRGVSWAKDGSGWPLAHQPAEQARVARAHPPLGPNGRPVAARRRLPPGRQLAMLARARHFTPTVDASCDFLCRCVFSIGDCPSPQLARARRWQSPGRAPFSANQAAKHPRVQRGPPFPILGPFPRRHVNPPKRALINFVLSLPQALIAELNKRQKSKKWKVQLRKRIDPRPYRRGILSMQ